MNIDKYLDKMDKLVGDLELANSALYNFADQDLDGKLSDEQKLRGDSIMDRIETEANRIM